MSPVHFTTSDLYLAAYLLLNGCELVGITKVSQYASTITLSKHGILHMVNDFNACKPVFFSVKSFGEKRDELKRLIKMQPNP